MVFTPDEEYLLYIAQTLIKNFHIIWIGVSALGFDFYMGPGWIYFIYPFVALAKGDPIVTGIISSLVGVLTALLIYLLGKKLFSSKVGIIASLVYAASALLTYYDQQPYPTGVPFLSVGFALSLYMTRHSKLWWILFAFLYGLVFHIHLSLVLVIILGIYWAITKRKTINKKIAIASIAAFVIVVSPLIVFDYFHKGSNITAPIRVIEIAKKNAGKFDIGSRLGVVAKSLSRVFYLDLGKSNTDEILYPCNASVGNNSTKTNWLVAGSVIVLLLIFLTRKDVLKDQGKQLLLLLSLTYLVPFVFLSSIGSVEYYLLGFFPILTLIVASSVESLNKPLKVLAYIGLSVFVVYNTMVVLNANRDYGLLTKRNMVNKVMNIVGDSRFELSEEGGPCQGSAGWRYLFLVYGNKPIRSSEDKIFSWLWPDEVSSDDVEYSVLIQETRAVSEKESGYKFKIIEGGFSGYVYER